VTGHRLLAFALALLLGLTGCTSVQEGYARFLETFRGGDKAGMTGQAAGDAPADGAAKPAPAAAGSGGTPINRPSPPPAAAAGQAGQPDATAPDKASSADQGGPEAEKEAPDTSGAMAQTPGANSTLRVGLNIQHLDIGMPLPVFGKNLAVVPALDGHKCVGLNGVNASQASFTGKNFKNFKIEANINYNFPLREGHSFKTELLSLRLGTSAERTFVVTITQGEAEPPMAVFSLAGPSLAPDMFCSPKPLRWKEDQPDATSALVVKKEAGSIRFEYGGDLICTSPLDPSLTLTSFAAPLAGTARIYDMAVIKLPDATAPGAHAPGQAATEEAQEQPFPAAETTHANGVTRFDLTKMTPGSPVGGLGKNLIVLDDEEGKYVASSSPEGSYVLLPAETGQDFSVSIIIKNAFVLSDRTDRTNHFFLFRVNYKNGVKELYTTDITRPANSVWRNRYYISRSGPDLMDWTASTDYRPWNNALDFNEYKVIKDKDLIRFFFNGEFIRSEKTMGDVLESVKVDLREHERLYNIIARDVAVTGQEQKGGPWVKERRLDDARDQGDKAAAPAKGDKP
jgi:hypothetical protein